VVLAIDPGSVKCGVAVVRETGEVVMRAIVPTVELSETVRTLVEQHLPDYVICGGGTGSRAVLRSLAVAGLKSILPVDESYSSELARRRYVAENPARGLARLLPASLRTPDVPYDDYVAVILAERFWEGTSDGVMR